MNTLHKDLHALLWSEVTEWGIPTRGLPLPLTKVKSQIMANAPE
jgi:hypothetical protein